MNVAETARKALDILDRDGWNKGYLTNPYLDGPGLYREGSHCIGGAWNLALTGTSATWLLAPEGDAGYELLAQTIQEQHPDLKGQYADWSSIGIIADWNNHERTTESDVRRILEKLAAG